MPDCLYIKGRSNRFPVKDQARFALLETTSLACAERVLRTGYRPTLIVIDDYIARNSLDAMLVAEACAQQQLRALQEHNQSAGIHNSDRKCGVCTTLRERVGDAQRAYNQEVHGGATYRTAKITGRGKERPVILSFEMGLFPGLRNQENPRVYHAIHMSHGPVIHGSAQQYETLLEEVLRTTR